MAEKFYKNDLDDVYRSYRSAKEYIDFVLPAHRNYPCDGSCPTLVFYESLNNFFSDDNNSLVEKNIFIGMCSKKNIYMFKNICHL